VPTVEEVRTKDCCYGALAAMKLPKDVKGLDCCEVRDHYFEMQWVGFPSSKIMCILRGKNSISGYLKLELHPWNTVQARIGLHNISSMKYNLTE